MAKKRTKNPFKMWGAWLGAILILFIPISFWGDTTTLGLFMLHGLSNNGFTISRIFLDLLIISIGFLIGWGLTVLFRRKR